MRWKEAGNEGTYRMLSHFQENQALAAAPPKKEGQGKGWEPELSGLPTKVCILTSSLPSWVVLDD